MAKKKTPTKLSTEANVDVTTLRSINIELDLDQTNRLEGFVPTNKTVALGSEILASLMAKSANRAFAVSAPYGSGKSSAALMWCQLLEYGNKKSASLKNLFDESKKKERSSGKDESAFSQWEKHAPKGLSVPLVGYEGGSISGVVIKGIVSALERQNHTTLAAKAKKFPKSVEGLRQAIDLVKDNNGKFDSLLIVWDEFGKVLEQAVAGGDGKALLEIQIIAEIAARSTNSTPIVFCILMHQSFARYSSSLPAYVRNEWAKIEGRFKQINYIEDSKEIYELISQVVSRKYGQPEEKRAHYEKMAESCHKVGIFKEFDKDSLTEILWSAAPLTPVSLYILPRVSARVAQNERTMFSYLWSKESTSLAATTKKWVTPADLFEFFKDLMRIDSSVGGAHRLWVEAQSALKKSEGEVQEDIVKALSCIKVGGTSGALAGTDEVIDLAFGNTGAKLNEDLNSALKSLEAKKAIFLRKLNGEYSVWQGSDVDIRGAVEEAKSKMVENLDVVKVLTKDFAPPYRFPQRHNDIKCIRRYFDGRYISVSEMQMAHASELSDDDKFLDGRIYYVVAETTEEIKAANKLALELKSKRVLFAIPRTALMIREGLSEIEAYQNLISDPDFSKQDPIIEQELKQLADDSEQHLKGLVNRIVVPSEDGPVYFCNGEMHKDITSMGALKRMLSTVCDKVYSKTPVFNNELINKTEPSPQIVNARKSIVRNLLEGYGKEQIGLTNYGPDVSIFRAVFLNSNLYRNTKAGWVFADQSKDLGSGLSEVWQMGLDFWSKPSASAKDLKALFAQWEAPPYGVRKGLYPLLLAATFKAAGNQAQVFDDGVFVTDYRPDLFEKMLRNPSAVLIVVPQLDENFIKYLDKVYEIFTGGKSIGSKDKVRKAAQAIFTWFRELPAIAREKGMCSDAADNFILAMLNAKDPTRFFSEDLKKASGASDVSELPAWLEKMKTDLQAVEGNYFKKVKTSLLSTIKADPKSKINIVMPSWLKSLPGLENDDLRKRYLVNKRAAGLINRVTQGYPSEELFVMSLAELFGDKPLKFWNMNTYSLFEVNLLQTIRGIEDLADIIDLERWQQPKGSEKGAGHWIEKRMRNQFERVIQSLGKEEGRQFIAKLVDSIGDAT